MYVHYSPGYLSPHSDTYFGALANAEPETIARCIEDLRALEKLMPHAWDGLWALIASTETIPPDQECRSAYECLRGAFSALHGACVAEAFGLMVEACEATPMAVRTAVIGKALREGAAIPRSGGGCSTTIRATLAAETLRTAHWIDPLAFLRTARGKPGVLPIPGLCGSTEEWIAYARSTLNARARRPTDSEPYLENVSASDIYAILPWCVPGHGSTQARTIASVVANIQQAVIPDVVAHIVQKCVTFLAIYEFGLTSYEKANGRQ